MVIWVRYIYPFYIISSLTDLLVILPSHSYFSFLYFLFNLAFFNFLFYILHTLPIVWVCSHLISWIYMCQAKRLGALNKFKAGECNILICTDVASRGLDIPSVDMVINYDIPSNSKVRLASFVASEFGIHLVYWTWALSCFVAKHIVSLIYKRLKCNIYYYCFKFSACTITVNNLLMKQMIRVTLFSQDYLSWSPNAPK